MKRLIHPLLLVAAFLGVGGAAAQAPIRLEGAAADATCNSPVLLVVLIDNLDRSRSKAYGEALRSTRIVPRHGGRYLAVSPPAELIEGKWPANRGFVIEQYPCRKAFNEMWYSDEYQKRLKPLREGSGQYTVVLFNAYRPAVPLARATGAGS